MPNNDDIVGETITIENDGNYSWHNYKGCIITTGDAAKTIIEGANFTNSQFDTENPNTFQYVTKLKNCNLTNVNYSVLENAGIILEDCNLAQGITWE